MSAVDLQRFCAVNDPRNWLNTPSVLGPNAIGCDGFMVIAIPRTEDHANLPDAGALMPKALETIERAAAFSDSAAATIVATDVVVEPGDQCLACKGHGRAKTTSCDDCEGDGFFWHGRHEYECQSCNGCGNVSEPTESPDGVQCHHCRGSGVIFSHRACVHCFGDEKFGIAPKYLLLLQSLPGCRMAADFGPEPIIAFRFDGGHGVVMPMRV